MQVLKVVDVRQYPARGGVVLQIVEHPVHLVELALGVLVLHAQLVAVGLAYGARLVRPLVPDVAAQVLYVVGLLLPDPEQLVNGALPIGAAYRENGELPAQVVAVHDAEFLDRVRGRAVVLPARTDLLLRVPKAVFEDVPAVFYEDFVGVAHVQAPCAPRLRRM